jgi:S-DNA-T family DNA segregation ATPase FtsK/SpoIIIE
LGRKKGRSSRRADRGGRLSALLAGFFLGRPLDGALRERMQEIKGLGFLALAIWLLVSLVTYWTPPGEAAAAGRNLGGDAGFYLANGLLTAFGWAGYLAAVLLGSWGCVIVARRKVSWPFVRVLGALFLVAVLALILQLAIGPEPLLDNRLPYGPGGWLAVEITPNLVGRFGTVGLWVMLVAMGLISSILATEMAFYPALSALGEWLSERRETWGEEVVPALWGWFKGLVHGLWDFLRGADLELAPVVATRSRAKAPAARSRKKIEPELFDEDEEEEDEDEEEAEDDVEDEDEEEWEDEEEEDLDEDEDYEDDEEEDEEEEEEEEHELVPAASKPIRACQTKIVSPVYDPPTPPPGPWTLPPPDLLEPPVTSGAQDAEFLERSARALEHALKSFRVDAEVVGAQVGPTVTLFELTVAQGTRMNRVTQLSQEIAATLRARSVRIIAPIPGKSTIGIEVPNAKRRVVRISELITAKAYDKNHMALPLFLGMDAEGNGIVEDLARCPHMLIAGTTGSGKSVCINAVLASILLTRSPHDVRLILVDPKMVELQMFANVPHLELPVVSDMRQATNVLLWAVEKMEGRYELFKSVGVKSIKAFNALGEDEIRKRRGDEFSETRTPRHVPYIVLVIDEMADLMMQSKKEAELAITRLAQKSRAVGIHVIVATQRPSTDVITGVIKGNLPVRIAFQVASKIDSRVILDAMGAEKLLGQGDMLWTPPSASQIRRVQGALVEDHELQRLIDFVCQKSVPTFNQELVQLATGSAQSGAPGDDPGGQDELFDEAVRIILKTRRGSASLLQRALGIGYTRASRLIDLMTEAGIVGAHKGSKAREILMTLEDWDEAQGAATSQGVNDG